MTRAFVCRTLLALLIIWPVAAGAQEEGRPSAAPVSNRAPLLSTPFMALPLGSVRPAGWLRTQCELQRDGLTGHAEEVYASDLGTNSAWLGGTGESWERGPYYFKGLVALAYTLDDRGLQQKAQKWIDWLLVHQGTNGYLGPASNNEWWPRMLATYALKDYCEATGDARVEPALDHYFRYMLANLPERPLNEWAKARAGDEMEVALWLYNRNGDTNLLSLVRLLREQAYDWTDIFTRNRFMYFDTDYQPKHNVNVEQALKFPSIYFQLSAQPEDEHALAAGWETLMRDDGLSCGINSGTEFLSGNASVQGVELCAIVEAMLSLETAVQITGNPVLADRLETISFNALPAALTPDLKGLQYYVLPNNVVASFGGHGFNQDYPNATVPGPNSGFPCCRYNFHMGWPKLVQNSWMATDDGGLAAVAYAPTVVHSQVRGARVEIAEDTGYPFEEEIRLRISAAKPVTFPLALRIPGWCTNATVSVNGRAQAKPKAASFYRLARKWQDGDAVVIQLPMLIQLQTGPSRSVAVSRGPLVYSLKIGERWNIRTPDPLKLGFDEYEVHPTTPWNYALQLDPASPGGSLTFTNFMAARGFFSTATNAMGSWNPFDPAQPSVALQAQAGQLPEWTIGWRGTHAFEPPFSPVIATGAVENVMLVPFGAQHLRVSWFPVLGTPRPILSSFSENFDTSWSRRWTTFAGDWAVQDGVLSTMPASVNGAKALVMGTAFTNFVYEADVSVGAEGDAGLIFRVTKPDIGADAYCGYYAGISSKNARLQIGYVNSSWHQIAGALRDFTPNKLYHLKIEAVGTQFKIYLDGGEEPVVEVNDDHFTSGMIGVRDYCGDADKSISSFSHVKVRSLSE